eukprot:1141027-Pelagomonas_calceolata.AAC.3
MDGCDKCKQFSAACAPLIARAAHFLQLLAKQRLGTGHGKSALKVHYRCFLSVLLHHHRTFLAGLYSCSSKCPPVVARHALTVHT